MDYIYLLIEGQQQGPYTEEQIRQSLAEGLIPPDLPAWHENLDNWVEVKGLVAQVQHQQDLQPTEPLSQKTTRPTKSIAKYICLGLVGFAALIVFGLAAGVGMSLIGGLTRQHEEAVKGKPTNPTLASQSAEPSANDLDGSRDPHVLMKGFVNLISETGVLDKKIKVIDYNVQESGDSANPLLAEVRFAGTFDPDASSSSEYKIFLSNSSWDDGCKWQILKITNGRNEAYPEDDPTISSMIVELKFYFSPVHQTLDPYSQKRGY